MNETYDCLNCFTFDICPTTHGACPVCGSHAIVSIHLRHFPLPPSTNHLHVCQLAYGSNPVIQWRSKDETA